MFGNGVATGTALTVAVCKPTPPALQVAPTVCFAAVVGSAILLFVRCRIASAMAPTIASTALAFVWCWFRNSQFYFEYKKRIQFCLEAEKGDSPPPQNKIEELYYSREAG